MDLRCSPWPAMDGNRGDSAMNRSHGRSLTRERERHLLCRRSKLSMLAPRPLDSSARNSSVTNYVRRCSISD
jgi:hypothetical protein